MPDPTTTIAPPTETLFDELMEAYSGFNQRLQAVLMHQAVVEGQRADAQYRDCVKQGGGHDECWEAAYMGKLYLPQMGWIDWPYPPPGPEALSGTFGYRMLEGMHSHVSKMKELLELELKSRKPE